MQNTHLNDAMQTNIKLALVGTPIQGPRGMSAYQIAVENGFVGTEAEWLGSLNGGNAGAAAGALAGSTAGTAAANLVVAGKANTDGSNVEADAFRGAIGAVSSSEMNELVQSSTQNLATEQELEEVRVIAQASTVTVAGKANTDGSNVKADAFRGAIGAASSEELAAAVAPLVRDAELSAATSPLATRDGSNVEADAFRGAIGAQRTFSVALENFAVGNGVTEDAGNLQTALDVALLAGRAAVIAKAGAVYKISTPVKAHGLTIDGNGATFIMGSGIMFVDEAVTLKNATVESSVTSGPNIGRVLGGNSDGFSGTSFDRCIFGRVKIEPSHVDVSGATAVMDDIRIERCKFKGDYTGGLAGDTTNVVAIRAFRDVHVSGNTFAVKGVERFLKISNGCRRVFVRGNSFICNDTAIGKQCIDLFNDSREVIVSGNIVNVTGFTSFVENKTGDGGPYIGEPSEVTVSENIITMSGAKTSDVIGLYGSYGLATQTLSVSTANVKNNSIRLFGKTIINATIDIRGFTDANEGGNIVWSDLNPDYSFCLELSNCRRITSTGTQSNYGSVRVGLARSHPNSTTYTLPPQSVVISSLTLEGYGPLGAINVTGAGAIPTFSVFGSICNPKIGGGTPAGFIHLNVGAGIGLLSVVGNIANLATADDIVTLSGASVTAFNMTDNSWQSGKISVAAFSLPAGGQLDAATVDVKGAKVGDIVMVGAPYTLSGAVIDAYVPSAGRARLRLRNQTASAMNFEAGEFRFKTARCG